MYDYSNGTNYFNRELSWIEFNRRVLTEGMNEGIPILEQLKFLSIVSSNFDEFFMIRVASLKSEYIRGNYVTCLTGMSPHQQLTKIYAEYQQITELQNTYLREKVLPGLTLGGLRYLDLPELREGSMKELRSLFMNEYFPLLTPLRVSNEERLTKSGNMRLHVGFSLKKPDDKKTYISVVQLPTSVQRCVVLPSSSGEYVFTLLENLIILFSESLFPGYEIVEHLVFHITRDADFAVDENRNADFVEAMEELLAERLGSAVVRLRCNNTSPSIRAVIQKDIGLTDIEVCETQGPLRVSDFMNIVNTPGFDHLRNNSWKPIDILPELEDLSIWDWIKVQDRILFHPFDAFNPVLKLLDVASCDPDVLAIKMTLYRTSRESPIVTILEKAAQNGKQITVLVELKARFDERRNIHWAVRLEQAGVIVVFGIAELKVHAKTILIIRREKTGIRRYVHIGTGNYNEKTATLYTDIGILSAKESLCYETGLFFNAITGHSEIPTLKILSMSPHSLKSRILQLIQREIDKSSNENQSHIIAKINSLADKNIIDACYLASQAGVKIDLIIRGICMLKPGVPGLSENISVISVVDRYLEHSRAVYFYNAGSPEVFISSADWMSRNLDRRVELLLPVEDREAADEITTMLKLYIDTSTAAYELQNDGQYLLASPDQKENVQQKMYEYSVKKKRIVDSSYSDKIFKVRRNAQT